MMSFSERGLPPNTKPAPHHAMPQLRAVAAGCVLGLLLLPAGCTKSENPSPADAGTTSTDNTEATTAAGGDAGARCTDLVASAVDMMQPDRLGITADSATAVDLINTWGSSCGRDLIDLTESLEQATPLITAAAGPEGLERVRQPRFDEQDIRHIRDALLMKQTVEAVIEGSTSETQRIVRLFDYTCRLIALEDGDESRLPLTPWHTLLFGRGTSRDRAWVFTLLLRQLKTDAVILTPATARNDAEAGKTPRDSQTTPATAEPWLVGVLSEGRVLLFSPLLGLPVPAAGDSPQSVSVTTPATLREVRENPELLTRLYGDGTAAGLAGTEPGALKVQVVACTSLLSERMAGLQTQLTGNQALVVFDGLAGNPLGNGLLDRVRQGGQELWTDEDVTIWNWPEQQQTAFAGILDDDRRLQRMLVREYSFRAPVRVRADEQRTQLVFDPTYTQLKTRVRQLLGDQAQAIRSFLTIRLSERINPQLAVPTEVRNMHLKAAEDACFWVASGQFEQGFAETAIESLELYLRKYPEGDWRDQSTWLLAQSLAARGQFAEAVARAGELSDGYPQQPGVAFLTARWQALAGGDGKPADPAPASTPQEPPANDSPADPPEKSPREPVVAPRPPRPAETPATSD